MHPLPSLLAACGSQLDTPPPRSTADVMRHYAPSFAAGIEIAAPGGDADHHIENCALSAQASTLHDCMKLDESTLAQLLSTAPRDECSQMLAQRRPGSVLFVLTLEQPMALPLPPPPGESILVAMLDLRHRASGALGRGFLVTGFKCHFIEACRQANAPAGTRADEFSTFQVAAATDVAHQRSLWVEARRGSAGELIVRRFVVRSEWGFLFDARYYGGG